MIKHVVMWRLKDSAAGASRKANAEKLKKLLESLKGRIPEILSLEAGISADLSDSSSDVVLYSEFEDAGALAAYQRHPEHIKVAEFVKEVCSERRVVDYTA